MKIGNQLTFEQTESLSHSACGNIRSFDSRVLAQLVAWQYEGLGYSVSHISKCKDGNDPISGEPNYSYNFTLVPWA